jgi:hypothetical protein
MVAVGDLLPRRELAAAERHPHLLHVDRAGDGGREHGVIDVDDLLTARRVDRDPGQPVLLLLVLQELDELLPALLAQQAVAGEHGRDVLAVAPSCIRS